MDDFSFNHMKSLLLSYDSPSMKVMDLGSYDVNGTFRPLMRDTWEYIGVDITAGPNVDVVMPAEYSIPLDDNSADLLISGSCLEHVKNPFRLMKEAVRILKPGCHAIVMVPYQIVIHRYPIDCWRFLPDGMEALFQESGLETIQSYIIEKPHPMPTRRQQHCWGIGKKCS